VLLLDSYEDNALKQRQLYGMDKQKNRNIMILPISALYGEKK
jgi:hypothetical protein